jgi:hypothetical protein
LEVVIRDERQVKQVHPDFEIKPDSASVNSQDVSRWGGSIIQGVELPQVGNGPFTLGRFRNAGNNRQKAKN